MSILTWIADRIAGTGTEEIDISSFFELTSELYARKLAFETAINIVANSLSKCEFKTYLSRKETKGKEYYLFNIEPNRNQNSSQFIHKLINKLYKNNECLVIDQNGQLLVADSFQKDEYALKENIFRQVAVGDFTFDKSFYMSDVMYFRLNAEDITPLINGMYEVYGKLIAYKENSYKKSRGNKGILNISAIAKGKKDFQKTMETLMNERFKDFFEADSAVLPLFDGYSFTDTTKEKSKEDTRDLKAMIDDVYDFTARAFRIPPVLLKGDVASIKDATDNYLTFCVDPLADMLQEEINRKRNGYKGFTNGNYLKIDTKTIKHIDLLSVATAIDKLIGSGVFNINDIRVAVGDEPIDEEWAKKHFITKNYATVEEFLKELAERNNE